MVTQAAYSRLPDGSFREPNYMYADDFGDPYATFYMYSAKKLLGIGDAAGPSGTAYAQMRLMKNEFKLWTPLDVYCLVVLEDRPDSLPDALYQRILTYLDQQYHEESGSYQWFDEYSFENAVVANCYATETLEKLGQPERPLAEWLSAAETYVYEDDSESCYGCCAMLYDLLEENHRGVEKEEYEKFLDSYVTFFENAVNGSLTDSSGKVIEKFQIPGMVEDFLKLCERTGHDPALYGDLVSDLFGSEESFRDCLFWKYDYLQTEAMVYSIVQSRAFPEIPEWLKEAVTAFDTFLLEDGEYISPFTNQGSRIDTTYFAVRWIQMTGLSVSSNPEIYYLDKVGSIESAEAAGDYGPDAMIELLVILQQAGIRYEDNDGYEFVKQYVTEQWEQMSGLEQFGASDIYMVNRLITLSGLLGLPSAPPDERMVNRIESEIRKNADTGGEWMADVQTSTESLHFLVQIGKATSPEADSLCMHLNRLLEQLDQADTAWKVELTFSAVQQLDQAGYPVSDESKNKIRALLAAAYYKNGFYKGGDMESEKVTYRYTYEAEWLKQWLEDPLYEL